MGAVRHAPGGERVEFCADATARGGRPTQWWHLAPSSDDRLSLSLLGGRMPGLDLQNDEPPHVTVPGMVLGQPVGG